MKGMTGEGNAGFWKVLSTNEMISVRAIAYPALLQYRLGVSRLSHGHENETLEQDKLLNELKKAGIETEY